MSSQTQGTWRKLIARLLLLVPLPFFVAWVNYRVDPANLFSGRERDIARILLSGKYAANARNFNDRALQRQLLESRAKELDVLVLGSSRSMQLRQFLFPGKRFHNASVGGGSLEDYVSLLEVARQADSNPAFVVFGLEPWILNPNRNERRWRTLAHFHAAGMTSLGRESPESGAAEIGEHWSRLRELLAPAYFQASIKQWLKEEDNETFATDEVGSLRVIMPDGSLHYDDMQGKPSPDVARARAQDYTRTSMHEMGNYPALSPSDQRVFEALLRRLRAEGKEVYLFLSPYHPIVFERLMSMASGQRLIEVERYFRSVANAIDAELIGSFHPAACGVSDEDFIDGIHLKDEAVYRLWKEGPRNSQGDVFETALRQQNSLTKLTASLLDVEGPWKLEWSFARHSTSREIEVKRADGSLVYRGTDTHALDTLPKRDHEYVYEATVIWADGSRSTPLTLSVQHHEANLGGVFLHAESLGGERCQITAVPNGGSRIQYIFYRFDRENQRWVNLTPWTPTPTWRGSLPVGTVVLVRARNAAGTTFTSPQLVIPGQ